ncbi:heat-inducible transcriptional repressor HrcA [Paucilactobacillus suebicus]|uniref:Heat-inducible transcription repressor HrcA n=1 Tax=Paucilactobacillus suebicus DSM 5007 = KCTC 3549 TaxID=1423807 RepID=A0A0R1W2J2_9LACO|nr:heat-inducible transcriptional repressor HrcA [Paucilactobacillus suebicus]KRM12065.1 heat-inducible transcription repressor [Paucilactobacillus suebicus DSM 5007 = KCTC 3549]
MLTQRQDAILQAIVRQYTVTGQPVGSKILAQHLPIKVSSATIRNEMAELEEQGLLVKEHSSSGRVPSTKGYRYYVDNLLDEKMMIDSSDMSIIQNSFGTNLNKIDEIVSRSADILSDLTSYTTFTLKPEQKQVRLSGFRLVPLGNHQVMAILVTDSGDVENQTFVIPKNINTDELESVIRLINDQLAGLTLEEVLQRLQRDIPMQIVRYIHSPDGVLNIFDSILSHAASERFFVGGKMNLLGFSHNHDPNDLQELYGLLDKNENLSHFLDPQDDNIHVQIGSEISNKLLDDFSLITATYDVDQYGKGIIAVLGPTRMPYSRTIGIVSAFRQELARQLLGYYHRYYDQ